ncbi:MAG: TerB family tellurite resistance protein [Bacteroidia bacterium]
MSKAKFGKWVGGTLGWAFGGPVGALLGFAIGAVIDTAEFQAEPGNTSGTQRTRVSTYGDFSASLLILSAAVMKADGKHLKSELDYVKNFFVQNFGAAHAMQEMQMLKDLLQKDIPLPEVCAQIRQFMPMAQRLQLLHYLFGIAQADGNVDKTEVSVIQSVAGYLGIAEADFISMKAMYFRDVDRDYQILETDPGVSDDDLKKAYRRMAVKYHPDKVSQLGEDVQRAAKEKFQSVQQAYDNIRKQRGI